MRQPVAAVSREPSSQAGRFLYAQLPPSPSPRVGGVKGSGFEPATSDAAGDVILFQQFAQAERVNVGRCLVLLLVEGGDRVDAEE